MNRRLNRRDLITGVAASGFASHLTRTQGEDAPGDNGSTAKVIYPRSRVPLSFIIDDSTCLVNMGHFCMPQFAEAWPGRETYKQPWRDWPREIPDAFVREFGEWCSGAGVKGKYSIVPFPACVGWLDRNLPGWSRRELEQSIDLVRELMLPNWDIHPEMITHTRVIDLKTGRPLEGANAATMENSYPQTDVSLDHLTEYLAFALRILKNCGLPCEGITTPGGFGNRVKQKLPVAVHQSVRDVFGSELPHYFKYVVSDDESTEPKLEFTTNQNSISDLTVNVPAGTGDWFGGWEGVQTIEADRYCNEDATSGRMVELIEKGQPAVMLCHWPGMYCNGSKEGFAAFKRIVQSIRSRFEDQTIWMKVSEIARYWAAKETVVFETHEQGVVIHSELDCSDFTFQFQSELNPAKLRLQTGGHRAELRSVAQKNKLVENTFIHQGGETKCCIHLAAGKTTISW